MANLDMDFNIVNPISSDQGERIKQVLGQLEGVNHVKVNFHENKINLGYTPGIINIQTLKAEIENQGVDVSDRGDE